MKSVFPIVLVCVFFAFSCSQEPKQGSDRQDAAGEATNRPGKLEQLKTLIDSSYSKDKEQCRKYVDALYEEASRVGDEAYLAVVSRRRGDLSYAAGQLDTARAYYLAAYKGYYNVKDTSNALKMYCHIGIMHSLESNFSEAEKIYRSTLLQAAGHMEALAFANNQMGTLYHYQGVPDSANHYYTASVALYSALEDTVGMLRPMHNQSGLLIETNRIQEAINALLKIYAIQKQKNDLGGLQHTTGMLASAYANTYDELEGMNFAKESYRYAQQLQDIHRTTGALISLARINLSIKDTELAMQYLSQARVLADSARLLDNLQVILSLIGTTYRQEEKYDEAVAVLTEALAVVDSTEASRERPNILIDLGQCYLGLGNLDKAKNALQAAVRHSGMSSALIGAYTGLAEVYLKSNAPLDAIKWGLKANESNPIDDEYLARAAGNASILYQAYKQIGNDKEALQYHEKYKTLSDSLNNVEEIRETTIQNKDFAFNLEKKQLETQRLQSELLLKAQVRQNSTIALSVGALGLLGFGFFWNSRRKNLVISEKNLQLEQLNTTKDRIFAIIGHDLRKPALAFRGITEKINYLLRKQDFGTLNALGGQIEQDAQALHQLTDNLLSWALAQKNVLPYNPAALSLRTEAEEVLALFQSVAAHKNISFHNEIPDHQVVYADKNTLHTILRNLLDNAIKFSHPGGGVSLSTASSEEGVVIKIADTGTGIPQEKLRDIFLLQKGKNEQGTAGEKGAGLGLHLVWEMVQLNRGKIEMFSQPNQGTEVRLLLPTA